MKMNENFIQTETSGICTTWILPHVTQTSHPAVLHHPPGIYLKTFWLIMSKFNTHFNNTSNATKLSQQSFCFTQTVTEPQHCSGHIINLILLHGFCHWSFSLLFHSIIIWSLLLFNLMFIYLPFLNITVLSKVAALLINQP